MTDLTNKQEENISDSIDNAKSIEEIASFTIAFNEAALKAGQNNRNFLANMYGDPSHFIFELLQNAEDSNATKVRMSFEEEGFVFIHNGRPFSIDDVIGICKVGNSNKDTTKIGKFGIGFKSVFAVTDRPSIQSGPYSFEIIDFNVPVVKNDIDKGIKDKNETKIIIPFDDKLSKSSKELIKQRLNDINADAILFLSSIMKIEVAVFKNSFSLEKNNLETIYSKDNVLLSKVRVSNTKSGHEHFIYASKIIAINDVKKAISIAFRVDQNELALIDQKPSKISVYFPTEVNSGLSFKINGPFETSPTRQQLIANSQTNLFIIKELLDLYSSTLITLKDKNILDYLFMIQLPLEQDLNNKPEIFDQFYEQNLILFKNNPLLIAENKKFYKPDEVYYSEDYFEINKLFTKDELFEMFNKDVWFLEIPKKKEYTIIQSFIESIDVEFINFNDIYDSDNFEKVIKNKATSQLVSIYEFAAKEKYVNHIKLFPKAFIRTSSNKFKAPFKIIRTQFSSHTEPLLFLPSDLNIDSEIIVDKNLFTDDPKNFFRAIGLREITYLELINIDLLTKLNVNEPSLSIQIFKEIMDIYSTLSDQEKNQLISNLKDKEIVPVSINGKFSLVKACHSVIKKHSLEKIYAGIGIPFLENKIQNYIFNEHLEIIKEKYHEFLERLNVNFTLLIKTNNSYYHWELDRRIVSMVEEKNKPKKINRNGNTKHFIKDHFLDKSNSISIDNEELSKYFWKELSLIPSEYFELNYNLAFENPSINGRAIGKWHSTLIEELNQKKWIYTKQGMVSPQEITLEEFELEYGSGKSDIVNVLAFKLNDNKSTTKKDFNDITSKLTKEQLAELTNQAQEMIERGQKYSEDINNMVEVIERNSTMPIIWADKVKISELKNLNENSFELQNLLFELLNTYKVNKNSYNQEARLKLKLSIVFNKEFYDWKKKNESKWIDSIFYELKESSFRANRQKFIEKWTSIKNYRIDEDVLNKNINSISNFKDYLNFDIKLQFKEVHAQFDLNTIFKNNLTKLKQGLPPQGIEKLEKLMDDDNYKSLVYFDQELEYLKNLAKRDFKQSTKGKNIYIPENFKIEMFKRQINKNALLIGQPLIPYLGTANQINKHNDNKSYSGKYAEHIVYKHLRDTRVEKLEWVSENAPKEIQSMGFAGLGYDFKYEQNGISKYVEVKSFSQKSNLIKVIFTINELRFAIQNADDYSLFICVKQDNSAIIHEISNPFSGIILPPPLLKDGLLIESYNYEVSFEI